MKDRYVFPAVFGYDNDGINVTFPDLPGCHTFGDTEEDAFLMAKDALEGHLYTLESEGDPIPTPTSLHTMSTNKNESALLVEAWMTLVRQEMDNAPVKKTLTIPSWLNERGNEHDVNFSMILVEGLKHHLGLSDQNKHPKP